MTFLQGISLIVLASFTIATSNRNKTFVPTSNRIIGGEFARYSDFKYIVSLRWISLPHIHKAGGSIIAPYWILTARHVLIGHQYFGKSGWRFNFTHLFSNIVIPKFRNSITENANKPHYDVDKTFCHPLSSDLPHYPSDSDIGLIKLKYPIPSANESDFHIQKVRLIKDRQEVDWERNIRIAGWGKYGYTMEEFTSDELRKAKLRILTVERCMADIYRPNQQLCAFSRTRSACGGDSGGPGVLKAKNSDEDIQVGIIAYGEANCTDKTYFTSVLFFKPWIDYIMETEDESYECKKLLENTHIRN